jgi:hypothetical protein
VVSQHAEKVTGDALGEDAGQTTITAAVAAAAYASLRAVRRV